MNSAARLFFHTMAAIFGSLAIIFAVAAWRLSSGPVSLGFLSPYIEDALKAEDLSYRIEFEDTILTWAGWKRSLDILVINARAIAADGTTLGTMPEISLGLSGRALLRGVVAPTSIELIRPEIRLVRTKEGDISLGLGPEPVDGYDLFEDLLADLTAPPDRDRPMGLLTRFSVLGAFLTVDDEMAGTRWRAPHADIILDRDENGIAGDLKLDIDLQGTPTRVVATTFYDLRTRLIRTDLTFGEVLPARASTILPKLDLLEAFALPVSGSLAFDVDLAGVVDTVRFEIYGGPGSISLPEIWPTALHIDVARAKGEVNRDFSLVRFDDVLVDFGGPSLALDGIVERVEAGLGTNTSVTVTDMPFDELGTYWPPSFLVKARRWILANVSDGVMRRFSARLDIEPGELDDGLTVIRRDAFVADFAFEDITVNYLDSLPKVYGVDGTGRMDAATVEMELRDGTVHGLSAAHGTARVWDIGKKLPRALIEVDGTGPARAALELLDYPRLGFASKMGLDPSQVGGSVAASFAVQFPLTLDLKLAQIEPTASVHLDNVQVKNLFDVVDITQGNFAVSLDSAGMDIKGKAAIDDVPANIVWRENFADDAPFKSRYEIAASVDEAAQAAWSISAAPYATGRFDMNLVYTDVDRVNRRAVVRLGARDVALEIPELFWLKPTGEEASISMSIELPPDGAIEIARFELVSRDLRAEGKASILPNFSGLRQAEVTRLYTGSTDIGAVIRPRPDGGYEIEIVGESLDLRPYIDNLLEKSTNELPSFTLDARVKRLITRADQQITDSRARIVSLDGSLKSAYLEGTLITGKSLRLHLEPDNDKRRLVVRSDDAGAVARAFDIYDNVLGGDLVLEATLHDDRPGKPVEGQLYVKDYRLINAPTLANILNIALLTGILDSLQGEGIGFSHLELPFTYVDDVITVKGAQTSGASIGINASGTVDLGTGDSNMRGTIVPAYTINSVLGNIPILGEILVGGKGEGLFAATFTVSGPIEEPTVMVNPLAALAPGFLRNLFSIFDGTAGTVNGDSAEPVRPTPPEVRR